MRSELIKKQAQLKKALPKILKFAETMPYEKRIKDPNYNEIMRHCDTLAKSIKKLKRGILQKTYVQ